uniref:Uncharacterized protein n=1 Tax=Rhizophora mucronata TaxID=61149 RepID=A0A2P2J1J3_RHIMU
MFVGKGQPITNNQAKVKRSKLKETNEKGRKKGTWDN